MRQENAELEGQQVPPLVRDFGFHHPPEYVEMAASLLVFSNWQCWPESGGWAEQDEYLVRDVKEWFRQRRRAEWEVKHPEEAGFDTEYEPLPDEMPRFRMDQ